MYAARIRALKAEEKWEAVCHTHMWVHADNKFDFTHSPQNQKVVVIRSMDKERIVSSSFEVSENTFCGGIVLRRWIRVELGEVCDGVCEVRSCCSDEIHYRSNDLLVRSCFDPISLTCRH